MSTARISILSIVVAIALIALAVYFESPYIALGIVVIAMIPQLHVGHKIGLSPVASLIVGVIIVVLTPGLIPSDYSSYAPELPVGTIQTDSLPQSQVTQAIQTSDGKVSATVNLYVKNVNGTVFNGAGTGVVFALPLGIVADRNELMKKVYAGNTGALAPYTATHTTGTGLFALNGFNAQIGDQIMLAGYQDATPGAGENVSWTKTVSITGITAGSTPEWMLSDSAFQWTRYPTMQFFDGSDIVRNQYTDNETAAIERSVTFAAAPHNVGEQWIDSYLWVESPESSISAIKKVKIVADDGSAAVEYGMPYEISSTENMFRAKPALNVTTNKMYMVGKFPADLIQQGASNRAKYFITPVYDHPATAPATNLLFYITTNTNALTTAGGHIDTPSGRFNLSLNNGAAADVWDWGN